MSDNPFAVWEKSHTAFTYHGKWKKTQFCDIIIKYKLEFVGGV